MESATRKQVRWSRHLYECRNNIQHGRGINHQTAEAKNILETDERDTIEIYNGIPKLKSNWIGYWNGVTKEDVVTVNITESTNNDDDDLYNQALI